MSNYLTDDQLRAALRRGIESNNNTVAQMRESQRENARICREQAATSPECGPTCVHNRPSDSEPGIRRKLTGGAKGCRLARLEDAANHERMLAMLDAPEWAALETEVTKRLAARYLAYPEDLQPCDWLRAKEAALAGG